jgi:hypothetical protein
LPISFLCPCGSRIKAKDSLSGKTVACPICDRKLQVPILEIDVVGEAVAQPPLVEDGPPLIDDGPPLVDDGPPLVEDGPPMIEDEPRRRKRRRGPRRRGGSLAERQAAKTPEGMGCVVIVDYLGAAQAILVGLLALVFAGQAGAAGVPFLVPIFVVLGLFCIAWGGFIFYLVSQYMALKRWAITVRIIFAVLGLFQFPIGTLINIYILIVLSTAMSSSRTRDRLRSSRRGRGRRRR